MATLLRGGCLAQVGGMVTLLRDHVAVTGQAPFAALAAASHPAVLGRRVLGNERQR